MLILSRVAVANMRSLSASACATSRLARAIGLSAPPDTRRSAPAGVRDDGGLESGLARRSAPAGVRYDKGLESGLARRSAPAGVCPPAPLIHVESALNMRTL